MGYPDKYMDPKVFEVEELKLNGYCVDCGKQLGILEIWLTFPRCRKCKKKHLSFYVKTIKKNQEMESMITRKEKSKWLKPYHFYKTINYKGLYRMKKPC